MKVIIFRMPEGSAPGNPAVPLSGMRGSALLAAGAELVIGLWPDDSTRILKNRHEAFEVEVHGPTAAGFEAARKCLGTEVGTLADFEAEHGPVQPPDGEG